jgi:hypothetical protein
MDTRRWPPKISYKIKEFVEYARSTPEICNMGDLSLFVCVQKYPDGYAIDLPGGRRNLGEPMEEALRRETIEESGVILFAKNNEDLCCQFEIDKFTNSDMCFHVIHQDVYNIGSVDGIGRIPVPYTTVLSGGSVDSRADDLVDCCDLPNGALPNVPSDQMVGLVVQMTNSSALPSTGSSLSSSHTPSSPSYIPSSPPYISTSPCYSRTSPVYNPPLPPYNPISSTYTETLPSYSPLSPNYVPYVPPTSAAYVSK